MSRTRIQNRPERPRSAATRRRIVDAAAACVRTRGFVGTTTSAIAEQAEVTEGSIFYHFGTLPELFAEVLRVSSTERLEAYQAALGEVDDPSELLTVAGRLFQEDLESGHVSVLSEMLAGAASVDGLRPLMQEHVRQWIAFVEDVLTKQLASTPFASMLPSPHQLAVLVVSLYTGAELLTGLVPDVGTDEALSAAGLRLAALASTFAPPAGGHGDVG
jgi:AcrR family transcriptional regulator